MRSEGRDVRLACARRDHHRHGFAGHDPQEDEHDNCDARERNERHKETPQDRKRDHRFVTAFIQSRRRREAPPHVGASAAMIVCALSREALNNCGKRRLAHGHAAALDMKRKAPQLASHKAENDLKVLENDFPPISPLLNPLPPLEVKVNDPV